MVSELHGVMYSLLTRLKSLGATPCEHMYDSITLAKASISSECGKTMMQKELQHVHTHTCNMPSE